MIDLLKRLKDSLRGEERHQVEDILNRVTDDVSDAAAALGQDRDRSLDPEDTLTEFGISADAGSNDEADIMENDDKDHSSGYIGRSSTVQWLRHVEQEIERGDESTSSPSSPYGPPGTSSMAIKRRMEALRQRQQQKPSIPVSSSIFYLDGEGVEMDFAVEPYKLPTVEVAQRLLDRYIHTVHDVFPVLSKETFTDQVRHYYASVTRGTAYYVPEKWLAILNLVFAIGARFSHLTEVDWQLDSQDHIVYQSRAHMLNLDEPSLVYQPDLMRVQVTALFAFYFLTVGNVSRAWFVIGISLRYALALGLHLRNEDQAIDRAKKEFWVHIWWALQILEGSLSTMLGRPCLVLEDYCSTPLPLPVSMEQLSDNSIASYWHNQYREGERHNNTARPAPTVPEPSNAGSLLRCLAEMSMIGQRAMTGLYSAKISAKSWKDTQDTIIVLYGELERWKTTLPPGFDFTSPNNTSHFMRERQIVQMGYIRIKILITRPCLCRLDSRIPKQSEVSDGFNKKTARICVEAAKMFTDNLPNNMTAAQLFQSGPWWSLVHHLMQALTVLLLELSCGTVHIQESEDILPRIKTLVRRLRMLKEKDRVAGRAYDVNFGILQRLALRRQVDISDLVQEDVLFPGRRTSQSSSMTGDYNGFDYKDTTSHQSLFSFPPPLPQHDSLVPALSGPFEAMPYELAMPGFSKNPFGTAHDEPNPFFLGGSSSA